MNDEGDDTAARVGDDLRTIGEGLRENQEENAVDLISGVRDVRERADRSDDPHLRFQAYFLTAFVQDMWNNVAMTSSQLIDDGDIKRILEQTGRYLVEIGEATSSGEFHRCYDGYVKLLETYEENVSSVSLNKEGVKNGD